tara:strand:+ start:599 stop:721 length:123 start_codon:yes stop_codon:yes gene_type:complete
MEHQQQELVVEEEVEHKMEYLQVVLLVLVAVVLVDQVQMD